MKHPKYIFKKLSMWWRGDNEERQFLNNIADNLNIDPELKDHCTPHLNPPFKTIRTFWVKHWTILLPIIVGTFVALFIHFDSQPESEAKEENQGDISQVHTNTSTKIISKSIDPTRKTHGD